MDHFERSLDLLGTIAGLIAFGWIGFLADFAKISGLFKGIKASPKSFGLYLQLLKFTGPYLIFIFAAVVLVVVAFSRRPEVNNCIKTIQAENHPPVRVQNDVAVYSDEDDFHIKIHGSIAGQDAREIISRYGLHQPGGTNILKVFATVSQSQPWIPDGLIWVQGREWGVLKENGDYDVEAYLGGIGVDRAEQGQRFPVRIYIPKDQKIDFSISSQYKNSEALPQPIFLSDPLYIKCLREDPEASASPPHGAALLESPSLENKK